MNGERNAWKPELETNHSRILKACLQSWPHVAFQWALLSSAACVSRWGQMREEEGEVVVKEQEEEYEDEEEEERKFGVLG